MTAQNTYQKPEWILDDFKKFEKSRPARERRESAALLARAFSNCRSIDAFDQALAWAAANNIRFFIDFTCTSANGYYLGGHGVVGIAARLARFSDTDPSGIAATVTHEIRHAWQDAHGLVCNLATDFTSYYIKRALMEADAYAMGELARAQSLLKVHARHVPDRDSPAYEYLQEQTEKLTDGVKSFLWQKFQSWYGGGSRLKTCYGEAYIQYLGHRIGLDGYGEMPFSDDMQFLPEETATPGIGLQHIEDILPLGHMFDGGGNYIATAGARDILLKEYTSPTRALSMFNRHALARPREDSLIMEREIKKRRRASPGFCIV